jgi:hypothetical protein
MDESLSEQDRAWIAEKPPERAQRSVPDEAVEGARAAIEHVRARGADSTLQASLAPQMGLDLGAVAEPVVETVGLAAKFVVPPFTVLDQRAGYWRERRQMWLSLGLRSELGREKALLYNSGVNGDPKFYTRKTEVEERLGRTITTAEFVNEHYDREGDLASASASMLTGTSVFDPVLCEVVYRWFSGPGATVLDPFAGGAVRGVIAGALGRRYVGVELRPEQVLDNREQAADILGPASQFDFGRRPLLPEWVEGDATQLRGLELPSVGLVFTCPPYADLEVYSDDPRDLSTAPYASFRAMLSTAMAQSVERMLPDAFAVWVVGEARDKRGISYGIVHDTVRAARDAGLGLYNEAMLLGSVGTAMLRAAKHVTAARKLERVHQHVLVFVKGDPKRAAAACGSAEVEA